MPATTIRKDESPSNERAVVLLQDAAQQLEKRTGDILYPCTSILTEADVQNHQILITYDEPNNQIKFSFALKPEAWISAVDSISSEGAHHGNIIFGNPNLSDSSFVLSESVYRQVGNTHLQVATATKGEAIISAAEGYVQIAVPVINSQINESLTAAASDITQAMELLNLSMWVEPVSEDSLSAWIQESYTAQNGANLQEHTVTIDEVYPGYFAPVVIDRAQELKEEFGQFALYHYFAERMLLPLAKTGVIYSKLGRMQRGLINTSAQSVQTDFETGGALGAFTTCVTEQRLQHKQANGYDLTAHSIVAILDPSEMDRTDYRALPYDWYGSKEEAGLTPREFIEFVSTDPDASRNEVVFNTGVKIKAFAVPQGRRTEVISLLTSEGVTEMNGKPIEECIIEASTQLDWLNIAWREQTTSIAVV